MKVKTILPFRSGPIDVRGTKVVAVGTEIDGQSEVGRLAAQLGCLSVTDAARVEAEAVKKAARQNRAKPEPESKD